MKTMNQGSLAEAEGALLQDDNDRRALWLTLRNSDGGATNYLCSSNRDAILLRQMDRSDALAPAIRPGAQRTPAEPAAKHKRR